MPEDPKSLARDFFFDNPEATFRDVAEELNLSYETVRDWGKKGKWYYKRLKSLSSLELPDDTRQQAEIIRAVLVRKIAVENMSADLIAKLVDAWRSLADIDVTQQDDFDRDALLDEINEA